MIGGCRRKGRLAGEVEGRGVRFARNASGAWLEVYATFSGFPACGEMFARSSGFGIPQIVLLPGALLDWECGEGMGDGRMISKKIRVFDS